MSMELQFLNVQKMRKERAITVHCEDDIGNTTMVKKIKASDKANLLHPAFRS